MSLDARSKQDESAGVVIIGGGVIGLSIAREFALRGQRHVTLIDRAEFGQEASWAAGGILAPQVEANAADEFFKLACASRALYPAFAAALQKETGVDVELDQIGTLYVAFTDDEAATLREIFNWQKAQGLRVEWLTGDDLCRLEPSLSPLARCGLRFPDDWQVENRKLVEALVRSNDKLGVRLVPHCEATALRVEAARVMGVQTSTGCIATSVVVVAAGAWSSRITVPDAATIEVEPVRGQMLCFKAEQPIVRHVIYSSRGYLVPRHDGRVLAGSTAEHAGFDKHVTDEAVASIKSMAFAIVPGLESLPLVDSWAGFRPHTPDDLPVLGADPIVEGLFHATGHYRNGILLAPGTARIIADVIIEEAVPPLLETFSPNRFQQALAGH